MRKIEILQETLQILLPEQAVCAAVYIGDAKPSQFKEEQISVKNAVLNRKSEFYAGRIAARNALKKLGVLPITIPVGPGRMPIWPEGIIGSITHTRIYAMAATAYTASLKGIGIDLEKNARITADLLEHLNSSCRKDVSLKCRQALNSKGICAQTLEFSIMEASFKAYFSITQHYIEWEEVSCDIDPDTNCFTIKISDSFTPSTNNVNRIMGRFGLVDAHLISVAWIN